MSRRQVNDSFGGQQLQTFAQPVAQAETAAQPVDDGRWKALANVFAQGAGLADTVRQQAEEDERAAAKRWAQSMTVGELGKAIKEGKMMPSQSPVFVGTAQHIFGVNTHEAGMRDMTTKLTTGELKFNSPEEADSYLTEWRNTSLAGQSEFAVAGFDKAYAQTRDKVMDQVAKLNDKAWVDNATVQATDFLANTLNRVTDPGFTGTPQEAAAEVMQQYQLMRHTMTLPEGARRGVMADMVTRLATTGNKDVLKSFLDSDMEGIGSVRGFLGATKAATLENQSNTVYSGIQRKRIDDELLPFYREADNGELNMTKFEAWHTNPGNKDFISAAQVHAIERANLSAQARMQLAFQKSTMQGQVEASEAEARRRVESALVTGNLPSVMGTNKPKVLDKQGDPKELSDTDVREMAERIGVERTKDMPFEQQVGFFAQNGLKNPNWEASMNAAFYNLNTIGVDSKGKPTGQLNDAGKQGLELFKKLDTYGDYARSVMSEKQYKRFSDIAFLSKMGRDVSDAAGLATAADIGADADSPTGKLVKAVHAQVGKVQSDPFYKWDFVQKAFGDNVSTNTVQLTSTLQRYATLLAHSGQYGTAEDALGAAAKYLSDPAVTVKVNGTVYLRSEMPVGPPTRTQDEWFDRFITEGPKVRAKALGFDGNQVRLEFDSNIRAYRAFVAGVPMTNDDNSLYVVTKDDISKWYATKGQLDVAEAASKADTKQQKRKEAERTSELQDITKPAIGGRYAQKP